MKVVDLGILFITIVCCISCNYKKSYKDVYLASSNNLISIYDENLKEVEKLVRGTVVQTSQNVFQKKYIEILYKNKKYYVLKENIAFKEKDTIKEKNMYIRTSTTIYKYASNPKIIGSIKKGEEVDILGYDYLEEDGQVHQYKIRFNEIEGYVYSKYTKEHKEEAIKTYQQDSIHDMRGNQYGGGNASTMDYYPYPKGNFRNNQMPEYVRAIYLNKEVIEEIDIYIDFALQNHINAFVIDIKDGYLSYKSPITKEYSMTSYEKSKYELEVFKNAIEKVRKNGIYAIGRIVVFKDSLYANDNIESSIYDNNQGEIFKHNGSYWPSAYNRKVWEYNVSLALEASSFGFNEIQFDYVRFPDGLGNRDYIDFRNDLNEERAEAIQQFLFYATDMLHEREIYVGADVFGEAAHPYVTGYGQYWPAISNVVDVISAMPYPDHFNQYDYGLSTISWVEPYYLLKKWGMDYASARQNEIETKAKVRTWIQGYDSIRKPYIVYNSGKLEEQIRGLYDAGLTDGYMVWNAGSFIDKYEKQKEAFKEVIE